MKSRFRRQHTEYADDQNLESSEDDLDNILNEHVKKAKLKKKNKDKLVWSRVVPI
jgi:hypothetical protein